MHGSHSDGSAFFDPRKVVFMYIDHSNGKEERGNPFARRHFPAAMVYAPVQEFGELYDPGTALEKGTIFKDLDLPFGGKSVWKGVFR